MDPSKIYQVSLGFTSSKTLLSAVELGVFTKLAEGPATAEQLGKSLGLAPRGWYDFFDGLVALGFLERSGEGPTATYRNGEEADFFLDRNKPSYIGGFLEMASARLFRFWGDLTEALRTGKPQNEIKHSGKPVFEELYRGANARSTEGSGLGLALVNRIISLHGGQIDVRSRQNGPRGTVFTVRLPEAKNQ